MAPEAGSPTTAWRRWLGLGLRVLLVLFVINGALGVAEAWGTGACGWLSPRAILLHPHLPTARCREWGCGPHVWLLVGTVAALAVSLSLRLGAAFAIVLAGVLIWGTLASTGADLWGDVCSGHPALLAVVIACWGGVLVLGAIRWGVLLAVQGVHLRFPALLRLTMIGHFFNTSLPGAVTGDLLKIAYIGDHSGERHAEAVLTIFLDRIFGILGLCLVASAMVLWNLPVLVELGREHRSLQVAAYTVGLGSVGGIVFILLVELRERLVRWRPVAALLELAARFAPHKLVAIVQRLAAALEHYRGKRGATLKALALAVGVHFLLGLGLYCAGRGINETGLSPRFYFLTAQVANTVAAIPLTPGGVGTRDMVAKEYFLALGARPAEKVGCIPVVMTLAMIGWGLAGAVVFVLSPRRKAVAEAVDETP